MKSADDVRFRGIGHGEENESLRFGLLWVIEMTWNGVGLQGITAWTSSVAAGKGDAGPSRPGVSCRGRKIMTMALASPLREAWAEEGFWDGHKHGDSIGWEEDTSHVFSLRKQSLEERHWAILALLGVGDHSEKEWRALAISTGSQRREIQKQPLNRNKKRKPTCKRSPSPLFGLEACLGVMRLDLPKLKVSPYNNSQFRKVSCKSPTILCPRVCNPTVLHTPSNHLPKIINKVAAGRRQVAWSFTWERRMWDSNIRYTILYIQLVNPNWICLF